MTDSFFQIEDYVYAEYVGAIVLAVELIRYYVAGVDNRIKPKYLVLIVAVLLAIPGYTLHPSVHPGEMFNWYKAVISFAFSTMGYQYIWEPIKKRYFPDVVKKQKS